MSRKAPDPDTATGLADLQDLFDHAPCGYLATDGDGRITRANRTLAEWLGRDVDQLVGSRFQDLLNIAGKIYYETHFAPLLRMQGFFHEVALDLVKAGGGALPVLVNAVERRDEAGGLDFIRITLFNASDRRRYERELLDARRVADEASAELRLLNASLSEKVEEAVKERLAAEAALRQAQKMEAIGQLTGGVAHDFNNLLTVIMGGVETIQNQIRDAPPSRMTERIQRSAAMALQGAQRAATLTARLLAFSRRQALAPKPLDPSSLVVGLADLLQRTLGETITLETVSGAGLWRTFVDPGELENALVNLAVNARDAMPGGGKLTVETSNAALDDAYVQQLPEPVAPGQYVLVAVTDTGAGMPPDVVERVFEPFFTTKEVGKGTGLGLSQVYGFVRQSGGHIRVYSEVDEGTTVKIYLPRYLGEAEEAVAEPARQLLHGGDEVVLLVEDHEALRTYAAGVLRELGYGVLEAANGPEALALLDRSDPVHLLFTDVVLPDGMNGRQIADEAVRRRPDLKVLYTTGYTRNAIVHHGRLDAGVHMIGKPFTARDLTLKVRAVLDAVG